MTRRSLLALAALTLGPHLASAQRQTVDRLPGSAAETRPGAAGAQREAPRHPFWVNVGIVLAADDMVGAAIGVTHARTAHQLITLRALAVEEWAFCINCAPGSLDRTLEAGLLYGVAAQSRAAVASVAAGVGGARVRRTVATGADSAPFFRQTERTVASIPVEAQLFVRPLRLLGLGVAGVVDLNPERSLAGVLVGVQLGRLRPEWGSWRGLQAPTR